MPTAQQPGGAADRSPRSSIESPAAPSAADAVTLAGYTLPRRRFVAALAASYASGVSAAAVGGWVVRPLAAQEPVEVTRAEGSQAVPMNQDAARSVRRPPKPGATARLTRDQRDALEHTIKCQCSCTLDVYTCRTTDFSCQVSPAMHRDVVSLVEGGYTADEIIAAFTDVYGEKVRMAPTREGFNLAGYWMPFAALGTGAVVLASLIRKWGRRAALVNAEHAAQLASHDAHHAAGNGARGRAVDELDATPEELARLEAVVRGEDVR